jgi:hypothetical protein
MWVRISTHQTLCVLCLKSYARSVLLQRVGPHPLTGTSYQEPARFCGQRSGLASKVRGSTASRAAFRLTSPEVMPRTIRSPPSRRARRRGFSAARTSRPLHAPPDRQQPGEDGSPQEAAQHVGLKPRARHGRIEPYVSGMNARAEPPKQRRPPSPLHQRLRCRCGCGLFALGVVLVRFAVPPRQHRMI